MQTFCFALAALPGRASPEKSAVQRATVIVFVMAADMPSAEQLACAFVVEQGWESVEVRERLAPTPQQILRLDTDMQELHRQAQQHGIAGIFAGASATGQNAVEVRSLRKPFVVVKNN